MGFSQRPSEVNQKVSESLPVVLATTRGTSWASSRDQRLDTWLGSTASRFPLLLYGIPAGWQRGLWRAGDLLVPEVLLLGVGGRVVTDNRSSKRLASTLSPLEVVPVFLRAGWPSRHVCTGHLPCPLRKPSSQPQRCSCRPSGRSGFSIPEGSPSSFAQPLQLGFRRRRCGRAGMPLSNSASWGASLVRAAPR